MPTRLFKRHAVALWHVLLLMFIAGYPLKAQTPLELFQCPVTWHGRELDLAFQGGLNAPQWQVADLNNDGLEDLVMFDRAGDILLPFLRKAVPNGFVWSPARDYAARFPDFKAWFIMRDYNADGITDLFTFNVPAIPGFKAYTGRYQNDTLVFDPYLVPGNPANFFQYTLPNGSKTQIYVSQDDIPAFEDMDLDGDLDLVTFDPGGGFAHLYRNRSAEFGHGADSLDFFFSDPCWGKFYESGVSEIIKLSSSSSSCASTFNDDEKQAQLRHAGSTLLARDMNGDGLKDLFLGDISFKNITLLTNGGSLQTAWMIKQDTFWPSGSTPVDMPIFPAIFQADIDFDGAMDLIVSPNVDFGALDTANVWYYRSSGGPVPNFALETRSFISDRMLDVGSGARPAFLDVNADGLEDMLVGNFGYYTPGVNLSPSLNLFLNTGSPAQPSFELTDQDYLGLSQLGQNFIFYFTPATGDLDQDGDLDLLIGHSNGSLFFLQNVAGAGKPVQFAPPVPNYEGLSVGSFSVPQIIDVDGDGLEDILMGTNVGKLVLFRNVGTKGMPEFVPGASTTPNVDLFGKVDMRKQGFVAGRSSPWLFRTKGGMEMLVGSNAGEVRRYAVDPNSYMTAFAVLDSVFTGYRDGYETHPTMVDLDSDGTLEVFIGNLRGGLTAYRTLFSDLTSVDPVNPGGIGFKAYAPAGTQVIRVDLSGCPAGGTMTIHDMQGRLMMQVPVKEGSNEWGSVNWCSGIYVARFTGACGSAADKLLWWEN